MITKVMVRKSTYRDSVTLMKISNKVADLNGVLQAAVVMATPSNKQLLKDLGLLTVEAQTATPNDLIIAIKAKDEKSLEFALSEADKLLSAREFVEAEKEVLPKTLESALRIMPDANLTVISVPGAYAKREAMKALQKGLHVFLFSSGVSAEDERELKEVAREKGLLVMGPDCGTAIINNVVFGFGNIVNPGTIGIVSASGTGLQQVSTIIDREGLGISQAIGTGGNDLSEKVGGLMMIEGIKLLSEDKNTQVIVIISKPPSPSVSEKVLKIIKRCEKPTVINFLGGDVNEIRKKGHIAATTLEDAAYMACALAKGEKPQEIIFTLPEKEIMAIADSEKAKLSTTQKYIRGLFSGGTLCYEAQVILKPLIGYVYSNVPLKSSYKLADSQMSKEHTCIDLGTEEFTMGRPHPMIDFTIRKHRIIQEANDPETAVILLDVVLGYGANPDPANELIPTIVEAKRIAEQNGRYLPIVASIIGTAKDPQDLQKQIEKLKGIGVIIMPTNAQATRMAALIATRGTVKEKIFGGRRNV